MHRGCWVHRPVCEAKGALPLTPHMRRQLCSQGSPCGAGPCQFCSTLEVYFACPRAAAAQLCMPAQARVEIMRIHMRDKQVDPSLDVRRLARACAGFTGAEIMGLMNRAAARAVRDKQKTISEDTIFKVLPTRPAPRVPRFMVAC